MNDAITIDEKGQELRQELDKKNREIELLNNKLAKQAGELNQFAYIVSHDLQAPLRMVTGFLELLEKKHGDKLDDSARLYIDHSVKGSEKMKRLIFDLLEYSRLSTVEQEIIPVSLNDVFQEVVGKYADIIKQTGAVIQARPLPVVQGRKKQLTQLMEQLFDNALKFRNGQKPEIEIAAKEEKDNWEISIRDNGIGLDAAFSEKIFIVFRRLFSDEQKFKGTGIGLAMCKKIVELHEGRIWVESAVNAGSTFYFSLPK